MDLPFAIEELLRKEDASVEWKLNVAESDRVVQKLVAFANDTETAPEGWIVCGAAEEKDEHGFQHARLVGLEGSRFNDLKKKIPLRCRQKVRPSLEVQVFESPIDGDPGHRLLLFHVRRSAHAHSFQDKYWITLDENAVPASNGALRRLFAAKGELAPFLERPCRKASLEDINLLAAQEFLREAGLPRPVTEYLEPGATIDLFARPLVVEVPVGLGESRPSPTFLALLLFGEVPTRFLPGAWVVLSVYGGSDRTATLSQRFETTGPLPKVIRDTMGSLRLHTGFQIDKSSDAVTSRQNRQRYSEEALQEALVNALAHRDYESAEPTRITVFSDRIEIRNVGGLVPGLSYEKLAEGHARWRNESLARFLLRMNLAQAEGQGIPLILSQTKEVAGVEPEIHADASEFQIILPAYTPKVTTQGAGPLGLFEEDIERAREFSAILYVESAIDVQLLMIWAKILRTPRKFWENVKSGAGSLHRALRHFNALQAAVPGIRGVLLLDGDVNIQQLNGKIPAGFKVEIWSRREIESYLLHPALLLRRIESIRPEALEAGEQYLRDVLPPAVANDPLGSHLFFEVTPPKEILKGLAKATEIDTFWDGSQATLQLAQLMLAEEIPDEVRQKLDEITATFELEPEARDE